MEDWEKELHKRGYLTLADADRLEKEYGNDVDVDNSSLLGFAMIFGLVFLCKDCSCSDEVLSQHTKVKHSISNVVNPLLVRENERLYSPSKQGLDEYFKKEW